MLLICSAAAKIQGNGLWSSDYSTEKLDYWIFHVNVLSDGYRTRLGWRSAMTRASESVVQQDSRPEGRQRQRKSRCARIGPI